MTISPDSSSVVEFARHGGALAAARRSYPDAPPPWIDLSTGINPQAFPVGAVQAEAWTRLPEAEPLASLETAAARRYRCASSVGVVAAPGTQAIIQALPALCPGRDVRVLAPTYSEFARVFANQAAVVRPVTALADLAGADVAVVVNPNNPDGRLVAPDVLGRLAGDVGSLIVDEAFIDALDPGWSLVPDLPEARTIVLRSFGKFYGLAGLRLGFAVAPRTIAARLRAHLGPWAVSGPALAIGARAFADDDWPAASRRRLQADAARLDALLLEAGLTLSGGTPLFRLAAHRGAPALFDTLAAAGILTRPFADQPHWLRFGLPGPETAWQRLADALASFIRKG